MNDSFFKMQIITIVKVNFCVKDGSELTIELIQINQPENRLIHRLGKTKFEDMKKVLLM